MSNKVVSKVVSGLVSVSGAVSPMSSPSVFRITNLFVDNYLNKTVSFFDGHLFVAS